MTGMTVFVTGGTSGLGLGTAVEFARRGADMAIFSSNAAAAAPAMAKISLAASSGSQRIRRYSCDVADRSQVNAAFALAVAEVGVPGIVLHMAGIGGAAPMAEMTLETFDRIMRVNVYGTRHVCEAALAVMRPRRSGKIVLAGSLGGFIPIFGYTAYGASKFAVVGFAQCLRAELKPLGIGVSCFCPGEVDTPGLRAERRDTPPGTMALKALGGTLRLEEAIDGLIRGIERDKALIIPGFRSKLLYWTARLTPGPVWNAVADALVARASRS